MPTTVKSLFVLFSVITSCVMHPAEGKIPYSDPADWQLYRELSEEEQEASAALCLFAERYWQETSERRARSDWRILRVHPEAIPNILEQRFKQTIVQKNITRFAIVHLEEQKKMHAACEEHLLQASQAHILALEKALKAVHKRSRLLESRRHWEDKQQRRASWAKKSYDKQ